MEADPTLAAIYQESLEADGWKVDLALDPQTALDRFEAAAPELMILDLSAAFEGLALLERMHRRAQGPSVPVIGLLNSDHQADTQRGKDLGVLAWLVKTRRTRDQLAGVVSGLLGSSDSSQVEAV